MDEVIAVTGATGRVGGRITRRLADEGVTVRALGRDAAKLAQLPVRDTAQASYDDAEAMRRALTGVTSLFLCSAHEGPGRVEIHKAAVDAALAAGVRRLVYLSYLGAAPDATFTYARDHWHTEQYIRATGAPFTFLRDSSYQSDLVAMTGDDGVLRGPAGDGRVAAVTHDDVADAAAAVLLDPEGGGAGSRHHAATYDLTGPEALSFAEIAATIGRVTGRTVSYHPETQAEAYASRAVYGAPDWEVAGWVSSYEAVASGEMDVVSDAVRALTGRAPQSFADFLATHPESYRRLQA
ncbi:NmrA family NAD(P)-binding protein [Streptacidiphilus melanogenes]|uniref:NmrA family NAD(P)-binding protein n=1 Tax=Streptacidiphilus melanogenes TaxID=411235 RepID=UPI0005A6AB5D|nr:NAD(P)H-binding protein [Streptacidiphilus melanogenes]